MENEKYPSELERGVSKMFSAKDFDVGRIGNANRWYKSITGEDEYDGDSLYVSLNNENYKLADGEDINDVGNFSLFRDTFREVQIGEHEGYMLAYAKNRNIEGPQADPKRREITLNLLVADKETKEIRKHEILHKQLDEYTTMPLLPEVYVNDQDKELTITTRVKHPKSMNFSNHERANTKTITTPLEKYGLSLEKTIQNELEPDRVINYISSIGDKLGCDCTYDPEFPETRKDIAAIRHLSENGSAYGYDTLYLVWLKDNDMKTKKITDSKETNDYIHIKSVKETEENILIEYSDKTATYTKKELGIK